MTNDTNRFRTTAVDGGGPVRYSSPTARTARRPEKVAEVVAHSIMQDIAARRVQPGTMLPPSNEMLERYRVGRASLREGLRILEIQGLITIKPGPGGGPMVAAANSESFGRMSTLHYQAAGATFRELIDARLVIEPLMAGLAAAERDPELITHLRSVAERTREGLADDFEYHGGASDFHGIIAGASGNRILSLIGRSLKDVYNERVSGENFPMGAREQVQRDHEAIVDTIEAGDAEQAEALMRTHMQETLGFVAERYPGLLDEVVDWR